MRNRAENQIILAFIRHGETQANAQRRYLGKTDESLSERGMQFLRSYKQQNLYQEADYLFTSPMKRCMETADILYPMVKPIIIPEWTEIDFGKFEYKNYEELKTDAGYQQWIASKGTMDFPDGENRVAFISRCESGFQRMCGILQQMSGEQIESRKRLVRVSAIVHGGTIMSLLSSHGQGRSRKEYFDYQTANGRGYLCKADVHDQNIVSWRGRETAARFEIQIKEIVEI